jgi:hypothetical protein
MRLSVLVGSAVILSALHRFQQDLQPRTGRGQKVFDFLLAVIFFDKIAYCKVLIPAVEDFTAGQSLLHGAAVFKGNRMAEHSAVPFFFIVEIKHRESLGFVK